MSDIEKTNEVEERAGLGNPPQWLQEALVGSPTSSGVTITPDSALSITAVYAAVRVIAETLAALPLKVYKDGEDGTRQEFKENTLWRLLHDEPNPAMSSYTFREVMTGNALTHGNGYAEIVRDGAGRPAEMWPLLPENMDIRIDAGELFYVYDQRVVLKPSQVLHIKSYSSDGIIGKSPIRLAREALGLTVAAEKMGGDRFSNAAHPGGVLEHPGKLSEDGVKNLRKSWEKLHRGAGNSSRVAILEEGMKFHNISIPSDDAQWLETRRFQVAEIARLYRVPPHSLGDLQFATFSNIEAQQLSFYRDTLLPWLARWEQEIKRKLVMADSVFAEHNVDGLLRGDTEARFSAYKIARDSGILSVNEIRRKENLNPVDGGDIYLQPLNMTDVSNDQPDEPLQEPDEDRGIDPSILGWLKEACNRALSIEANAGRRLATKNLEKRVNPQNLIDEMTTASKRLPDRLVEITEPIIEAVGFDADLLRSTVRVEASGVADESLKGLAKILRDNESDALVASAELKNWYDETTADAANGLAESIYGSWSKK